MKRTDVFEKDARVDRRRYTRLDQIFPVEYRLCDAKGCPVSPWRQAFTQDINQGGLCLVTCVDCGQDSERSVSLDQCQGPEAVCDLTAAIQEGGRWQLRIHIPYGGQSVDAMGHRAWSSKEHLRSVSQYAVGIAYDVIDPCALARMMSYARWRGWAKHFVAVGISCLVGVLVWMTLGTWQLKSERDWLVEEIARRVQGQEQAARERDRLQKEAEDFQARIDKTDVLIIALQEELASVQSEQGRQMNELTQSMGRLQSEKEGLRRSLSDLLAQKVEMDLRSKRAQEELSLLEDQVVDKLTQWLRVHSHRSTGFVSSFEGDSALEDMAFLYDQALAMIVFTYVGQTDRVGVMIETLFKNEQRRRDGFFNAYYASNGQPAEFTVHVGPNAWLGIAALHYYAKSQDSRALTLAKDIAAWIATMTDDQGGVRGGPQVSWYSTEHNLDVYAFYQMMARLTGEQSYVTSAQAVLRWLVDNAYSNMMSPPVKRGKGDATVATDTFAWSIAAVGPTVLRQVGMDPDQILDFALSRCAVTVSFAHPSGESRRLKGFDFCSGVNVARGGVVSSEWTAQMVVSFFILARDHQAREETEPAARYQRLAQEYLLELNKMIISSFSPVGQGEYCLPYASAESADTGHGWRTPRGTRTGSVAGTAYTILAARGINPLSLDPVL